MKTCIIRCFSACIRVITHGTKTLNIKIFNNDKFLFFFLKTVMMVFLMLSIKLFKCVCCNVIVIYCILKINVILKNHDMHAKSSLYLFIFLTNLDCNSKLSYLFPILNFFILKHLSVNVSEMHMHCIR